MSTAATESKPTVDATSKPQQDKDTTQQSKKETTTESSSSAAAAATTAGGAQQVVQQQQTQQQPGGINPSLLVKHPLQYRWVLWYCKHDRSKDWEDCLKIVTSFDTVEDFWALYNHIQLASGLNWSSDYYLFKEGIKPMWEDEQNVRGGRWLVKVDKARRGDLLDHYWLELLMAMIGEQFDDLGEYICGGVVNVRNKGDKISLWSRDAEKDEVNRRIGEIIKQKLGVPEQIVYEAHKDTSIKQSSSVKPKMLI